MEYYSAIKNNDVMKFTHKWMEVENSMLSEVTQSKKNTYGMHSMKWIEARNTQDTIHRPLEAQEEGKPKCGCFGPS